MLPGRRRGRRQNVGIKADRDQEVGLIFSQSQNDGVKGVMPTSWSHGRGRRQNFDLEGRLAWRS